jgi:hydroxymethylglutaryl-CoA reductase
MVTSNAAASKYNSDIVNASLRREEICIDRLKQQYRQLQDVNMRIQHNAGIQQGIMGGIKLAYEVYYVLFCMMCDIILLIFYMCTWGPEVH